MEEGHRAERSKSRPLVVGILVLAGLGSAPTLAQQYSVEELALLPNTINPVVTGINAAGQIVGTSRSTSNYDSEATLWSGTSVTGLNEASAASGISDNGQVAGYTYSLNGFGDIVTSNATTWNATNFSVTSVSASVSQANAINSAGLVVGSSGTSIYGQMPTVWNGGVLTMLPALTSAGGEGGGAAYGVNAAGQVVGQAAYSISDPNAVHATLWVGTSATDLGALAGYDSSSAQSINASGQVVGSSFSLGGGSTATLWKGGKTIALSPIGGIGNSGALGINDSGEVVGWSESAPGTATPQHATLWIDGNPLDLNTLVGENALFTLTQAVGVNNSGQIAVDGVSSSGELLGFLLNPEPVPLPASLWLLLGGLGGVGLMARYRRADLASPY